ncbi:hypothetical protein HHI36_012539, partial [Cryptolaemus montrouzieri]
QKKNKKSKNSKIKGQKVSTQCSDEEEDDCFCIYCLDSYEASKPCEERIQCIACKKLALEKCLLKANSAYFVCNNCNDSDDE